jgi:HEAT repeat protein
MIISRKVYAVSASLCLFAANMGAVLEPKSASYDELIFHVQRYGNTPEKREWKSQARAELFARGTDSLREMMRRVHFENVAITVLADEMVRAMDTQKVAAVLVEFLDDAHPRTRKLAAYWLGFHDTPEYADRVLPLLKDDEAAGAAIRTLGKWRVREAIPQIVPFLSHEKETRRIVAANALRDIGDPGSAPYLIPLLSDRVFTVREVAARALSKIRKTRPQCSRFAFWRRVFHKRALSNPSPCPGQE